MESDFDPFGRSATDSEERPAWSWRVIEADGLSSTAAIDDLQQPQIPSRPCQRSLHSAVADGDSLFVFGGNPPSLSPLSRATHSYYVGYDGSNRLNDFYQYNFSESRPGRAAAIDEFG